MRYPNLKIKTSFLLQYSILVLPYSCHHPQEISVTSALCLLTSYLHHKQSMSHHQRCSPSLLIRNLFHLLTADQQPLFINPAGQVCSSMLAYQPLLITLYYCCCYQLVLFYSFVTLCKCTVTCSRPHFWNIVVSTNSLLFV